MRQTRGKNGRKPILNVEWPFYEDRKEFRCAASQVTLVIKKACDIFFQITPLRKLRLTFNY